MKKNKKNWFKIFFPLLSAFVVLIPMVLVAEKIFYYATLFIVSRISINPIILFYIIFGFIGFTLFSLLMFLPQKKIQYYIVFLLMFFSISIPIVTSFFNVNISEFLEPGTIVYLVSGVIALQLLIVLSIFGRIKKSLLAQVEKNLKSNYLFSFVKVLLYLLLIPIYAYSFQDNDGEILSQLGVESNSIIEILSIIISYVVFINLEKIYQAINKSGTQLMKLKKGNQ